MKSFLRLGLLASALFAGMLALACGGDDDEERAIAGAAGTTTTGRGGSGGAAGSGGSTATGGSGGATGKGGSGGTGATGGSGATGGTGGSSGSGGKGGEAGTGGTTGKGGAAGTGGAAGASVVDGGSKGGTSGTSLDAGRDANDASRDTAIADASDVNPSDASSSDANVDGAAGCGLANLLSKTYFDSIFPLANRNAVYTYEGLLAAAASYPAFANRGSLDDCRKETAAFLANVARETGRLRYAEEIAKSVYCGTRTGCACDASTTDQAMWYYGRGAIQLTWNYNYCSAGSALATDLLAQPSIVHTEGKYAWATALWYWMTSKGGGTMTCHTAMTGGGIFGDTIRAINGGECGKGGYSSSTAVKERVDAYIQFAKGLGIPDPGMPTDLDC